MTAGEIMALIIEYGAWVSVDASKARELEAKIREAIEEYGLACQHPEGWGRRRSEVEE